MIGALSLLAKIRVDRAPSELPITTAAVVFKKVRRQSSDMAESWSFVEQAGSARAHGEDVFAPLPRL
jgi:hypothetical protein